jgi:soluble lytic murein transglycosylase-like protein
MRTCVLRCIVAACLTVLTVQAARGNNIYKCVNKRGTVFYTNIAGDKRCVSMSGTAADQPRLTIRSTPDIYRIDRRYLRFGTSAPRSSFDQHIHHAARLHRLDPLLVKAVIKTESGFNRYAVSSKGAQGLMQLMPATARHLGVNDPFDPWQNIYGGAMYLREMLDSFNGDLSLSLAAYNAGPTTVMRSGRRIPRIPETVNYVGKVLTQYRAYKNNGYLSVQISSYAPRRTSIRVRQLVTVN